MKIITRRKNTIFINNSVPKFSSTFFLIPKSKLNCEVLWDDLAFEVRWAVAGDSIVMQLVCKLEDGEYMSFGISGDDTRSKMIGGDPVISWVDKESLKGYAVDYFLDSKSQCAGTRGSCPDERLREGTNSVRLLNAAMVNGYSIVTYQRPLKAQDELDRPVWTNGSQPVFWAIGPLNSRNEVSYHSLTNKGDLFFDFGRTPKWNCPVPETDGVSSASTRDNEENESESKPKEITPVRRTEASATPAPAPKTGAWEIPAIQCYEPDDGVFYAQMGPTGGKHGYPAITGHVGWGISWYINGLLIPEINVVRGKTYTFVVEGGVDPDVPARYHPFYITDDPVGGYEHKTPEEKQKAHIYAGVRQTRKGDVIPTGTGRLCNWTPDPKQPPADEFVSFGAYQRTLTLECDQGEPGVVQWTPDEDTPDTVYYQCFTHRYLGWKINVLDNCDSAAAASEPVPSRVKPENVKDLDAGDDDDDEEEGGLLPQASIQVSTRVKPDASFFQGKGTANDLTKGVIEVPSKNNVSDNYNSNLNHKTENNTFVISSMLQTNTQHIPVTLKVSNYDAFAPVDTSTITTTQQQNEKREIDNTQHGESTLPVALALTQEPNKFTDDHTKNYNEANVVQEVSERSSSTSVSSKQSITHYTTPHPTPVSYKSVENHTKPFIPPTESDSVAVATNDEMTIELTRDADNINPNVSYIIKNITHVPPGLVYSPVNGGKHISDVPFNHIRYPQRYPAPPNGRRPIPVHPQMIFQRPSPHHNMPPFRRPIPLRGYSHPINGPMYRPPIAYSAAYAYKPTTKKPLYRVPVLPQLQQGVIMPPATRHPGIPAIPQRLPPNKLNFPGQQQLQPQLSQQQQQSSIKYYHLVPVAHQKQAYQKVPSKNGSDLNSAGAVPTTAASLSYPSIQRVSSETAKNTIPNPFNATYSPLVNVNKYEATPEMHLAINTGFDPNSIVIEGGFKPIPNRKVFAEDRTALVSEEDMTLDDDEEQHESKTEVVFQESLEKKENPFEGQQPEMFEPIFIPSPPDRISAYLNFTQNKNNKKPITFSNELIPPPVSVTHRNSIPLKEEQQYILRSRPNLLHRPMLPENINSIYMQRNSMPSFRKEESLEVADDKMPMAAEQVSTYYLPPRISSLQESPRAVVAYDGRPVSDVSLLSSISDPSESSLSQNNPTGSADFIRKTPQFGPFKGEIPPPIPGTVQDSIRQLQNQKSSKLLTQINNFPDPPSISATQLRLTQQSRTEDPIFDILLPDGTELEEVLVPSNEEKLNEAIDAWEKEMLSKISQTTQNNTQETVTKNENQNTTEKISAVKENMETQQNVTSTTVPQTDSRNRRRRVRTKRSAHHEPGHTEEDHSQHDHDDYKDHDHEKSKQQGSTGTNTSSKLTVISLAGLTMLILQFLRGLSD